MATTPSDHALIAHLLRRTSFGPFPGQVAALVPYGIAGAIDRVLAARPLAVGTPPDLSDDSSDAPVRWWYGRMVDRAAGLHEKMTWFWHGIVTVSHEKVFWWQVEWKAHLVVRSHALGDYRQLLRRITSEPAMLLYLDGDWSLVGDSEPGEPGPNENYARELQELFTIGQPNIQQVNVLDGARALAGWHVDWENATSVFIEQRWASMAPTATIPFLGRDVYRYQPLQDPARPDVIDAACDHPATAPFIADKAWRYLVGTPPTPTKVAALATAYRRANLDTRVLVERIVRDPQFLNRRHTRAKYPVEWVASAMSAAGLQLRRDLAMDMLWRMGQVPFYPPSVAGWPTGDRWLSPSLALSRAALATESPAIAAIANAPDPVAAALARCSLYEVTAQTRKALEQARVGLTVPSERAAVLLALCLASPEFALA
jgi:uncharacterized protein (DUF1800 family)